MKRLPHRAVAGERSVALLVTLAFIALLSTLILFYFAQTASYHTLSNSGFNDFKSGTLGQSALQVVVGDLQQEIANGSTNGTYGTSPNQSTLYIPTNSAYMLPRRSGNPALTNGVDPIPNLVRRSVRADPIAFPGIASRASAVNSSTDAALNGQYVSLARWNKHYLIPRNTSEYGVNSTIVGTDPASTFTAPDWVFLTSSGPAVLATPSTNVIGRYAYAIYNEGGLLDVNVAGFPSQTATNSLHPATPNPDNLQNWGYANKGSIAFANLTTLGLTQAQIDKMIGWRNNASAQISGSFDGGYSLSPASALLYHDFVVANTNGFLSTSGQTWAGGGQAGTDQAFTSRQSLIAFATAASFPLDALQYLATFTRDTEQPSYIPAVGRPQVQNATNNNTTNSFFGTGNNAWSFDRTGTPSTDINPPFLSVRVATQFNRPDSTIAYVGDPLVKKRFPLSRLSLVLSSATATQSQSDPIYRNFGLYRGSAGSAWSYNHGNSSESIYRLDQVKGLQREPDFFELLKAAINVGSLGKASCYQIGAVNDWTTAGTQGNLQQARNTLTDLQILQIGANIIDQAKTDNFPTRIQFAGDTSTEVRGIEDLPYLYRFRNWVTQYSSSQGAFLIQPELWNPHSTNSSTYLTSSQTPSNFRVRLTPQVTGTAPILLHIQYLATEALPDTDLSTNVTVNAPNYNAATPTPAPVTFNAGEANGYWGFREPTLLSVSSVPLTAHVANTDTATFTDVNTKSHMTGILLAEFPWHSSPTDTEGPNKMHYWPNGNACLHLYLEYQDSGGNWITYEDAPFEYQPSAQGDPFLDLHTVASASFNTYAKAIVNMDWRGGVMTDPRTTRLGFAFSEWLYALPIIDLNNSEFSTERPNWGVSNGSHYGLPVDVGFVNANDANYSVTPQNYRGFQHGYWAENSVRPTYQSTSDGGGAFQNLRYNHDPDGVVRRVMGGYATDTANGGVAAANQSPTPGLPLVTGTTATSPVTPAYASRPTILHRPFRSVAELGYVFRDTPWGNINFSFPESGDAALLDVFCINENSDPNGLVAGRVDLNTRQAPVLEAILSGSLLDKDDATNPMLTTNMAASLATQLVTRTSSTNGVAGYGPLSSRADLVGTWTNGITTPTAAASALKTTADPNHFYSGFSADIGTVTNVFGTTVALIPRQREAPIRALADIGTTRTWNLLIDLIAQSGRFPANAKTLASFSVEGEKHYWLHIAIDRFTGKVLASQLEVVKE